MNLSNSMSVEKEIILTGFGPFGDISSNPTEKLINSLKDELQDKLYQLYVLPVSYDFCSSWSEEHISDSTSLIIHFGVSAKSNVIQLERTGKNIIGSSADVNGKAPQRKILESGPEEIQSKLDLESVQKELGEKGFNCEVSDNAGDYLCNFILYKSLMIAPEKSLFVHVPPENVVSVPDLKDFTLELLRSLQCQVG